MAWKEVIVGDTRWAVSPVAERVANTHAWRLMLSCRSAERSRQAVWVNPGLQSSSRSDLYAQADRLPDERLAAVVAQYVQGLAGAR
jgi:hypothetical protein